VVSSLRLDVPGNGASVPTLLVPLRQAPYRITTLAVRTRGDAAAAVPLYRELLHAEPTLESVTRQLFRCNNRLGDRAALVQGDLGAPESIELGPERFDAAVAVQSLHHVDDDAKRRIFAWLGRLLEPGALLLVYDRVHHGHDDLHPATPEEQLPWLRAAGFEPEILGDALLAATRR